MTCTKGQYGVAHYKKDKLFSVASLPYIAGEVLEQGSRGGDQARPRVTLHAFLRSLYIFLYVIESH